MSLSSSALFVVSVLYDVMYKTVLVTSFNKTKMNPDNVANVIYFLHRSTKTNDCVETLRLIRTMLLNSKLLTILKAM